MSLPEDVPEVHVTRRLFENFLVILDGRRCDKHCPYCTAKITNWQRGQDRLELLGGVFTLLEQTGLEFDWLTISGNGEPGYYPHNQLVTLADASDQHIGPFRHRRIQTGGKLFHDESKWRLFRNWVFELTRVAFDPEEDERILGYNLDYTTTDTYRRSRIGMNLVLLRENFDQLPSELHRYRDFIGDRLDSLNLKILNVDTRRNINTRDGDVVSPQSRWIQEHGLLTEDVPRIIDLLSKHFRLISTDETRDRITWDVEGVPLHLVTKQKRYGRLHLVFHCGHIIDYLQNEIDLDDLK